MRLTKGAITNLIANYKSVLTKMFARNQASCKKQTAALLACLIMATAAPAMGASPNYEVGTGGDATTLDTLDKTLTTTDYTITFLANLENALQPLTAAFTVADGVTATLNLINNFDDYIIISGAGDGAAGSFILAGGGGAGTSDITLTVDTGEASTGDNKIVISGFSESAINSDGVVSIGKAATDGELTFTENHKEINTTGEQGGGGAIIGDTVEIVNGTNKFINNTVTDTGSGNTVGGGAIAGLTEVKITDGTNTFTNNSVKNSSGDFVGIGGAIASADKVTIVDGINTFDGNKAYTGGAIAAGNTASNDDGVVIEGGTNVFINNTATVSGGAIYSNGEVNVTAGTGKVTISGGENYFGITAGGNTATYGGAIKADGDVTINSTVGTTALFVGNTAYDHGGAIWTRGNVTFDGANTVVGFSGNTSNGDGNISSAVWTSSDISLTNGANLMGNGGFLTTDGNIAFTGSTVELGQHEGNAGTINLTARTGTITFDDMTLKGQGELAANKEITIVTGLNVDVEDTENIIISAQLAGSGALVKDGLGTLTLSGDNNAYSGAVALDVGRINVGHNDALGSGALTMENNTTLGFAKDGLEIGNAISTVAGGNVTATIDTNGCNATVGGTFTFTTATDTLKKTGGGTLTLADTTNDYSGGTLDIDKGTLALTALELDPEDVSSPNATFLKLGNVNNNARLNLVGIDGAFYQKVAYFGGGTTYTGDGVIGLQASATDTEKWSDGLFFDTGSTLDNTATVGFAFAPGSTPKNMTGDGLVFADIANADSTPATPFKLDNTNSTWGAYDLKIKPANGGDTYNVYTDFNPTKGKVYSEVAAAGLGQAAWMHGRQLFNATGEVARDAAANNTTGVFAGYERVDSRFDTGSHADVKGNNFTVAVGFKANEKTTWGAFGQMFKGDYDTDTGNSINSSGDMDAHDFGLFVEYRPAGRTETGSGHYYKGIVRAGRTSSDFRANNGLGGGYTNFSMGQNVFGMSFGGGYVKAMDQDRAADIYTHLIYTGLNGNTVTDNIGQEIKFGSSNSFRLLTGARLNFNKTQKTGAYVGAALDYEFSGTADAFIDGFKADKADLKGLIGILELGLVTKPNATTAINLGLQGYVGKKQGLGGTLAFSKLF